MKTNADGTLRLSATDLASFLSCRHRTALEMGHAHGKFDKPKYDDPHLELLFARGLEHEAAYVKTLVDETGGDVERMPDKDDGTAAARTLAAMQAGKAVIVQGVVGDSRWYGRTDVLQRVERPSKLGAWSYEVADTKLSRETKAGTVLQLVFYSALLERVLGHLPEQFHVVTPDARESYRTSDYAPYAEMIWRHLDTCSAEEDAALASANYPEPVDHCDICPWTGQCKARRRKDDHLSLVAGISRTQRRELTSRECATLTQLAQLPMPLPFTPTRGAADSYERVREQARVQLESRGLAIPKYELLPIVRPTETEPGQGLCRLPEPSPGDIFLDLEGDPFVGPTSGPPMLRGREYLFGVVTVHPGPEGPGLQYTPFWAEDEAGEKRAFEAVMDLIAAQKAAHPGAHVYHYAPYEPSAFKRLMGRHATREQEMDALLRSETFVDLYGVVRQGLRAGIERYSIKNLEVLYGFTREVDLKQAREYLQAMELAVESNRIQDLKPEVRAAVQGYNQDDCVSTFHLRNWLEKLRAEAVAQGEDIPRPALKTGEASEALSERQAKVEAVRGQLLGAEGHDRYLMAYLLDYHRREQKAEWWDYFRLLEMADEELIEEPGAVSGLTYVQDVEKVKRSVVQRYSYPQQEMELRRGDTLKLQDQKKWSEVVSVDRVARTIDVLVGPSRVSDRPTSAFRHDHITTGVIEDALMAIGESVVSGEVDPLAMRLLQRVKPSTFEVTRLSEEVLALQGPPGAGKTYTGGKMICDLVAAGKNVGIAATGHKVIENLLTAVAKEAKHRGLSISLGHRRSADESAADDEAHDARPAITIYDKNETAHAALEGREVQVLGGTAWLWTRPEFEKSLDVLFIDEAGQVSLANALAMTRAAKSLVLLGDPQQLDQPKKGSHPDGVEVSVLEHILGGAQTMPEGQGLFLGETWRFGNALCNFTSQAFYEGKLRPTTQKALDTLSLTGGPLDGAGPYLLAVEHDGNRNNSDEEVAAIAALIDQLVAPGSMWIDAKGAAHQMTKDDVLVVSPYNVQVSRLAEALPGVRCGTVDKFQGQEAPVSIYSMATSRPEDAPRGMEFLYSLNRLNVATSRAQCASVVVASPRLFEPECKTPAQIKLASALCLYETKARVVPSPGS